MGGSDSDEGHDGFENQDMTEAHRLLPGEQDDEDHTTRKLDLQSGSVFDEAKRICKLAGPLAFQDLTLFLQGAIAVAFVGRLGPHSLSAMILCSTTFNITGLSLVMGIASGAETLSGQCFGARNYRAVGVILQRSLVITWLSCLLIMLGWTQISHLLSATGQPQQISNMATDLLWLQWPALFAIGTTECFKRYLMAQSIVVPTCVVYTICTVAAPLIEWIFVFWLGLGLHGSAAAYNVVSMLNCLGLLIIIYREHVRLKGSGRETWHGWCMECLQRILEYLGLAIPSTVMLCLEWWTFEIIILMAGKLRDAEVNIGVMGILFQIGGLCYMVPLGLQGAVSTRVSNTLGEGRPHATRTAVKAVFIVSIFSQTSISALIFIGRSFWGRAFSSDAVVVDRIAMLLPFLSSMIPCDGFNAICSGIVRGCGRQLWAACLNLLTFWGVGIPLAAVLAFSHGQRLGVTGLWIAMSTMVAVQSLAMALLLSCCFRWERESKRAEALVKSNMVAKAEAEGHELV